MHIKQDMLCLCLNMEPDHVKPGTSIMGLHSQQCVQWYSAEETGFMYFEQLPSGRHETPCSHQAICDEEGKSRIENSQSHSLWLSVYWRSGESARVSTPTFIRGSCTSTCRPRAVCCFKHTWHFFRELWVVGVGTGDVFSTVGRPV